MNPKALDVLVTRGQHHGLHWPKKLLAKLGGLWTPYHSSLAILRIYADRSWIVHTLKPWRAPRTVHAVLIRYQPGGDSPRLTALVSVDTHLTVEHVPVVGKPRYCTCGIQVKNKEVVVTQVDHCDLHPLPGVNDG